MLLFISALILNAHANFRPAEVFHSNSPLPIQLQEKILKSIESQCPSLMRQASTLIERSTREVLLQIDQGQVDKTFHTELVSTTDVNGEPTMQKIEIQSAEGGWSNPRVDKYWIEKLIGCP